LIFCREFEMLLPELRLVVMIQHSIAPYNWRALGPQPKPVPRWSRQAKATLQAPLMALVGWIMFYFYDHRIVPFIVWTLSFVVLAGGWLYPPAFLAIERFGLALARVVTRGLTWILLAPFFYICFTPGRMILLLTRKDPMDRIFPDQRPSFWIPRQPVTDPARYRNQH